MNKVVLKAGLWRDWMGDGVIIPPVGVSLIVSNGLGVERCHELALAMIRESLLKEGLKEAVIFSRRGKVKGRYLTFAQGVEGEGCFNRWSVLGKDVLKLCRESSFEAAWTDGCSLQYDEADFLCEMRRELGWFGPKMILIDLEFADLSLLTGLAELARRRKCRIIVTSSSPFRAASGGLTLPTVEVAAQAACGRGVDELADAVVCVQGLQPDAVSSNPVVEVLKGQFFATRSKAEQQKSKMTDLIAMAWPLLTGKCLIKVTEDE